MTSSTQEYGEDFVSLVEMIYGEGLLSQGGFQAVDKMFEDIDLNGLKVLDLGCGLGMCDIHLAKYHETKIVGIDPQQKLIEKANANLERYKQELKGSVSFLLMKDSNNLREFSDSSFDLIFSKESLLHVPYEVKEGYFKEIYRVLKSNGQIVIMDWMHSGLDYSDNTKKMMEMDGIVFQLLTPKEYQNLLEISAFKDIEWLITTFDHAQFSQSNIETIMATEDRIKSHFGEETYQYCLESWTYQRDAFQNQELLTAIFRAKKD